MKLKKFLSFLLALTIFQTIPLVSSASESNIDDDEVYAEQIIEDILNDPEFENSNNFMFNEMLNEIEEDTSDDAESDNNGTSEGVSPRWSVSGTTESDHAVTAIAAMGEVGEDDFTSSQRAIIKRCLIYGSYKADTYAMHNREDPYREVVQLHAIKNYVANLKILWKYAKLVKNSQEDIRSAILDSMPNLNTTDVENANILIDTIPLIFDFYSAKYDVTTVSNFEKKYLVIGLAIHLIGDIYAHRTYIPASYGNVDVANQYFTASHFVDFSKFITKVSTGEMLPTQTKNYMLDDLPNAKNTYYEDNISFIPQRYALSKVTSKNFVRNILISGNTFSPSYIDRTDISLYAFDIYVARAKA